MLESVYVKYSLSPEIAEKATKLWGAVAAESRKERRPNVAYGQSGSGKLQFDFLRDILSEWGVPPACIREELVLPFPGYFLAQRRWDMGVFSADRLLALIEFKHYTLQYKHKQSRAAVVGDDLAFKALDLQLAAAKAGVDRSRLFVGAFVQIFWKGQPDFTRELRRTRHPTIYDWAHTKQESIRKSLNRLVESGLYDSVVSMEANCLNGRDVRWWSFPEQDLRLFLDSLHSRLALEGVCR